MKNIYRMLLSILVVCLLLNCQFCTYATNSTYTTEIYAPLRSNGVAYPDSPDVSMLTDEDGYAWVLNRYRGSASIFQYDLTDIPANATVVKAEWKMLTSTPNEWKAGFTSFEYEDSFEQSATYNDFISFGYEHPNSDFSNCYLTKQIKEEDYVLAEYSEYKGELIGTVYGDASQLSFDMTNEVNAFLANGKKKFNFGVAQTTILWTSHIRIPIAWNPAPQLILTIEFDSSKSVDSFTTTRYNDWLLNLHLTSPVQIAEGIKGGEAGQAGQALAISPSNPQIMVCGNDMAGVYSSSDGGKSWKNTSEGLMTIGVSDLFFDPNDSNIVLALGTTTQPRRSQYPGIYRSTDAGKTWNLIKQLPIVQRPGRYFQAGKSVNGIYPIYAGTNSAGILSGIYVSYDHGTTWQPRGLDTQVISDVYADNNFLAVSTSTSGLFMSYDSGVNWKRILKASGLPQVGILSFIKDPADSEHMFAIDETTLYETTDGGISWTSINSAKAIGVQKLKTLDMMEDPNQAGKYILYAGTSFPGPSVRYSEDNGRTFLKTTVHSELSFMSDVIGYGAEPIEIDSKTKTIFAFFDGDLHKSTDGGRNFYPSMSGYSGMRTCDYVFDANDPDYLGVAQTDRGFMQTIDAYTASEYRPFDYSVATALGRYGGARTVWAAERQPSNTNHIIVCMGGISADSTHILKRSTDNGKTWNIIEESEKFNTSSVNRIFFHPQNDTVIYAGYLKSVDGGETWTELERMVSSMSPTNGNIVYNIGTDSVYVSEDAGATWDKVADGIITSRRGTVDYTDPYILYIGTFSNGLYKIDAKAKTKTAINTGLVESEGVLNIKDISQDSTNPMHFVCGGANNYTYAKNAGFFESFDGGQTWSVVEGLPGSRDVWTVEFHPNPDVSKVYVGTSAGTFVYEWTKNPANSKYINN